MSDSKIYGCNFANVDLSEAGLVDLDVDMSCNFVNTKLKIRKLDRYILDSIHDLDKNDDDPYSILVMGTNLSEVEIKDKDFGPRYIRIRPDLFFNTGFNLDNFCYEEFYNNGKCVSLLEFINLCFCTNSDELSDYLGLELKLPDTLKETICRCWDGSYEKHYRDLVDETDEPDFDCFYFEIGLFGFLEVEMFFGWLKSGKFDGCYFNGSLVNSKIIQKMSFDDFVRVYCKPKSKDVSDILSSITEQINNLEDGNLEDGNSMGRRASR